MMERYYVPWAAEPSDAPFQRDAWTKGVAAFLCRVGKLVVSDKPLDDETKCKLETKFRTTLEKNKTGNMPDRVVASSQDHTDAEKAPAMDTDTLLAVDQQGTKAAMSCKRLAVEAGLALQGEVIVKKQKRAAGNKAVIGIVRAIQENGVLIAWEGTEEPQLMNIEDLAAVPKNKEKSVSASSQALEIPGFKWSPCSNVENAEMLRNLAHSALYQLYVSQSASHGDLHLVENLPDAISKEGPIRMYACREFKENTLVILPFSAILVDGTSAKPSNAAPLQMVLKPDKEEPTVVLFWVKSKPMPKKLALSQEKAAVVVPFWALSEKPRVQSTLESDEVSEGPVEPVQALVYKTASVKVPCPAGVHKGVRVMKANITMKVVYMTNASKLEKGTRVIVTSKPAGELEEEEEEEDD